MESVALSDRKRETTVCHPKTQSQGSCPIAGKRSSQAWGCSLQSCVKEIPTV